MELNKGLLLEEKDEKDIEAIISEMVQREELLCTGYACGVDATGI